MVRTIIISQYVYNTSIHINRSNSIRLLYCIKNVHVLHAEILIFVKTCHVFQQQLFCKITLTNILLKVLKKLKLVFFQSVQYYIQANSIIILNNWIYIINKIGEATEFEGDTYAKKYIKILMQPKKKKPNKQKQWNVYKKKSEHQNTL